MSTRSCVAIPQGDSWKGRYVHSDGYPRGVGMILGILYDRDGLDVMTKTLTEAYYGWSYLSGDEDVDLDLGRKDGRFIAVPDYGVAYTTKNGQSSEDDWVTPYEDWNCEWTYIMTPAGVHVLQARYLDDGKVDWLPRGLVRWGPNYYSDMERIHE